MAYRENLLEDYDFSVSKIGEGYSISLPHQCDDWEILGANMEVCNEKIMTGNEEYGLNYPKDKEMSIKQMKLFIKRAKQSLEELKKL